MDLNALAGRDYAKFLAAGCYFLKKYRGVVDDLNVYPVPDGDTGTNMYLTIRTAALHAYAVRSPALSNVAAAAARGALMGARGNSGVILSQMLRGFAYHVRHRSEADAFVVATGLREAAAAARRSLLEPAEGTILSVADAAANAAYRISLHEKSLLRCLAAIVKAANEALDATPSQLPALATAGVVDAGGAGYVYLLEGVQAFLPEARARATAFPRQPNRATVFSERQSVGKNRFCTELIVENASCSASELQQALRQHGESLLVGGSPPTLKVHVHTDRPKRIENIAARYGSATQVKVDDMERQHRLLIVDVADPYSVVAVVPGSGFDAIVRELGAEVTIDGSRSPSVAELSFALNACRSRRAYLFADDDNVVAAAREAAAISEKNVTVVPTSNVVEGINGLLAMAGTGEPDESRILDAIARTKCARVFVAAKDSTVDGTRIRRGQPAAIVHERLIAGDSIADATTKAIASIRGDRQSGLVTLYYGGTQREKDARQLGEDLQAAFANVDVEYYFGGMRDAEYWIAFDE